MIEFPFNEQLPDAATVDGVSFPAVLHGSSPVINEVLAAVDDAARGPSSVLIIGEPGTGRDDVARAIHARSARRHRDFVVLDCGDVASHDALAPPARTLLTRHDGTVLLSGIDDLPDRIQQTLAEALRNGAFRGRPNGGLEIRARIIATAEPGVGEEDNHRVRRDLLRRVTQRRIDLPPLRHRREDIPAVAAALLRESAGGRPPRTLAADAAQLLAALPWSGNLAELSAIVRKLAQEAGGGEIGLDALLKQLDFRHVRTEAVLGPTLREAREAWEREFLLGMLNRHRWQIQATARTLGIQRPNLYRKLRALRIQHPKVRRTGDPSRAGTKG